MNYNFIEIGTSDFSTLIESAGNQTGISIEPVKYYLDKLPNPPRVIKLNAAIVTDDTLTETEVYYVEESIINEHDLGWWLKGCNSVGKPHDFHTGWFPSPIEWHKNPDRKNLKTRNLVKEGLVTCIKVPCYTFKDLVIKYDVESIDFLKIDTEGQDAGIVHSMLDFYDKGGTPPKKLEFETNAHNNPNDVNKVCKRLSDFGYVLDHWDGKTFDSLNNEVCNGYYRA